MCWHPISWKRKENPLEHIQLDTSITHKPCIALSVKTTGIQSASLTNRKISFRGLF